MTITGPGRTLFVSDLDGTLLGEGGLSATSRELLVGALEQGVDFTVASARSPRTALQSLAGVPLRLPFVAYGGATAVDTDGTHLWWERFDARALHPLIGASLAAGVTPLVFWLQGSADRISWVRGAETAGVDAFLDAREGDPRLLAVDGWDEVDHDQAFFVSITGEYPVLRRLARMIRAISWGVGCSLALQRDPNDGLAVLDVTAVTATKGSAVRRLAADRGYDRIVAFGDGANDLPLFAEADESYAAPGVLQGDDAVARFLGERVRQQA